MISARLADDLTTAAEIIRGGSPDDVARGQLAARLDAAASAVPEARDEFRTEDGYVVRVRPRRDDAFLTFTVMFGEFGADGHRNLGAVATFDTALKIIHHDRRKSNHDERKP